MNEHLFKNYSKEKQYQTIFFGNRKENLFHIYKDEGLEIQVFNDVHQRMRRICFILNPFFV